MSLLEECLHYLEQPGFERFIEAWLEKYRRLGHLGGRIQLEHLNKMEQEALGLLLGMDLGEGTLQLDYRSFQKQWSQTRFESVDFLEVLTLLRQDPLYSRRELRHQQALQVQTFCDTLLTKYAGTPAFTFLEHYFKTDVRLVYHICHEEGYPILLEYVLQALNALPVYQNKTELLPVFSWRLTRDPHYFDQGMAHDLLLRGIAFHFQQDLDGSVDNRHDLLFQAGVLRDDLSNACLICHIVPCSHPQSWQAFYDAYEPWNMTLYNLMQVEGPFSQSAIYMVENPSVFRELALHVKIRQLDVGLVCSNGQINLSTYRLIDRLLTSGCTINYAGDWDPEGLQIADKLVSRYPRIHLWGYDVHALKVIGLKQTEISESRQSLLKHYRHPILRAMAREIRNTSLFGYQEGLLEKMKKSLI